ncbi:MAG: AlkZ family DNA glycosylase [Myxococcales bacterium]|nr:AlkZ family DNA glycosylase [Myxococcales bacterium]
MTRWISRADAADFLVGHAGLRAVVHPPGAAGLRALLAERRCIQLDPLDRIGTNADLVAMARVDGVGRGDVFRHLYPGHAFEHFAKERCLLPASAFAAYRDQAVETPWWRSGERHRRVPPAVVEAVLAEVHARGPLTPADLSERGRVDPIDWGGWKGTARLATMALEILWTRCDVVTCGRRGNQRLFDVPARALGPAAGAPAPADFGAWALRERVEAAGLLPTADGPWWSMLRDVRRGDVPARLLAAGELVEVGVEGSTRRYLAPADFQDRAFPADDERLRILGPLDPLLWCRPLIHHVFGFDYVWEVYKPAEQRRFGWYVCPLLHRGRLVGRIEAHVEAGEVVIDQRWAEAEEVLDLDALEAARLRHQAAIFGDNPL